MVASHLWALLPLFVSPAIAEQITQLPISFNWGAGEADSTRSFATCSDVSIDIYPVDNPSPAPRAPYYLLVYPIAGVPEVVTVGGSGSTFHWTPNFRPGTQVILAMTDSRGISGGISTNIYSVTTSTNQTCLQSNPPPTSQETVTVPTQPNPPQCQELDISWTSTQTEEPYTISVIRTGTAPVNITGIAGTTYKWENTIQTGGQAIIAISDRNNVYLPTSDIFTSGSGDASCLAGNSPSSSSSVTANPTSTESSSSTSDRSSSNVGAIAGGAAAGVIIAALLGASWWLFHRKRKRQSDAHLNEKKNGFYSKPGGDHSGEHLAPGHPDAAYGGVPSTTLGHVTTYSHSYAPSAYASTDYHSSARSSVGGRSDIYPNNYNYPPPPAIGPNHYPPSIRRMSAGPGRFYVTNPDSAAENSADQGNPQRNSLTKAALTAELNFGNSNRRVVHAEDAGKVPEAEVEELPPVYRDTRQPTPTAGNSSTPNAIASGSGSGSERQAD